VNNLRVHVKPMYQLYTILKDHDEPPTLKEIDIASAKQQLDGKAEAKYLKKLEKSSENIKKAFQDQQARAIVSEDLPGRLQPGFPLPATYYLMIGAMGPGDVQESSHGMGHCM